MTRRALNSPAQNQVARIAIAWVLNIPAVSTNTCSRGKDSNAQRATRREQKNPVPSLVCSIARAEAGGLANGAMAVGNYGPEARIAGSRP